MDSNSDFVDPTQVRWATVRIPVRDVISPVTFTVRSRALPPAPYVTDTKSGSISESEVSALQSFSSPSLSRGGKNSKEKEGFAFTS